MKGATGFEPVTSRSAVECSTTELCPLWCGVVIHENYLLFDAIFLPFHRPRANHVTCK